MAMKKRSINLGDELVDIVENGLKGNNIGLKHGIKALERFVPYIRRGTIITILAGTGVGKSLFLMHSLAFEALLDYYYYHKPQNSVFYWLCYSMEMDREDLLARLGSYILFRNHDIAVTPLDLISGGGKELSEEVKRLINTEIKDLLNVLSPYIEIRGTASVNDIDVRIEDFYKQYGELFIDKYHALTYETETNPFLLVSADHVGIFSGEGSKKSKIDLFSEMAIKWTTACKTSFIDIQQLNRSEGAIEKLKFQTDPKPNLAEAKDSGGLIDASHIVIALFSPARFDISRYFGFTINDDDNDLISLKDNYRSIHVLKNRYGGVGTVHSLFYGAVGYFKSISLELQGFLNDPKKAVGIIQKIRKLIKV